MGDILIGQPTARAVARVRHPVLAGRGVLGPERLLRRMANALVALGEGRHGPLSVLL
ncbi:hypothetical protein [Streptomyces acidicola]|uniref:hypothetical protein n=1 Tax=Streptomyces acidicola TaxID=2596892 RepID=UPI0038118772